MSADWRTLATLRPQGASGCSLRGSTLTLWEAWSRSLIRLCSLSGSPRKFGDAAGATAAETGVLACSRSEGRGGERVSTAERGLGRGAFLERSFRGAPYAQIGAC